VGLEGNYQGDSTMGERGVATEIVQGGITMKTVQWGRRVLPWRQHSGGERCYHGDSIVSERGVTMETVL
jgi:hypothetical protein